MHVTLVGLGNIGSHAAQLIARAPQVSALTLIDFDTYRGVNYAAAAIGRGDINRPKATVQAQRLQKLHPEMRITAICDAVENVPVGRLCSDILIAAVDTRIARQYLGQVSWGLLGIPWIDSGVNAEGGLVSVSSYVPGEDNACIECDWSDRHYATLEVPYPCCSNLPAARTNAPASLGGLAGALLAIECGKLLSGLRDQSLVSRQMVYDTRWHKYHVIVRQRNPTCRFDHHAVPMAAALVVFHGAPLAQVFAMTDLKGVRLKVAGTHGFATRAFCPRCERDYRNVWKLARGLRCPDCKQALTVSGFDSVAELNEAELPPMVLRKPLNRLGLQPGDILVLKSGETEECVRVGDVDA